MTTNLSELAGKTALVTGASSGLGTDFARQLAAAGCNLIITARREDRLNALKAELMRAHPGVTVDVIVMDLTARNAARHLYDEIASWGRNVDVLINNAGYGLFGWFLKRPWTEVADMIQLNTVVTTELAHIAATDMVARGYGKILFIASMAGYQATPTYAAYAATKAHVLHLGEALNFEFRGTGVSATVLSPGMTATEFLEVSGQSATLGQRMLMMESADVVRVGLSAMMRNKASVIPGFWNNLVVFTTRLVPRSWLKWIAYGLMRNEDVAD